MPDRRAGGCNVQEGCPFNPKAPFGWWKVRYAIRHPIRTWDHLFVHGYWV